METRQTASGHAQVCQARCEGGGTYAARIVQKVRGRGGKITHMTPGSVRSAMLPKMLTVVRESARAIDRKSTVKWRTLKWNIARQSFAGEMRVDRHSFCGGIDP